MAKRIGGNVVIRGVGLFSDVTSLQWPDFEVIKQCTMIDYLADKLMNTLDFWGIDLRIPKSIG